MSLPPDMGLPNTMSEADYAALPEGIARRIEVVHGYVIVCEPPTPQHQQVTRRLATTLEAARPAAWCWPARSRSPFRSKSKSNKSNNR
jgi:hypothetical protein